MTTTTMTELQQLDRAEIIDLVALLGACLDDGSFDDMAEVLAEDATVRTPGGRAEGRAAVIAQAGRTHPADQSFHHVSPTCGRSGRRPRHCARQPRRPRQRARRRSRRCQRRLAPHRRRVIGDREGTTSAFRTPAGWRFSWIEIVPVWLSGTLPPTPPPSAEFLTTLEDPPCQSNTTVRRPKISVRCSMCARTARRPARTSVSPGPLRRRSSTPSRWLTRRTSWSMMGPSSSVAVA